MRDETAVKPDAQTQAGIADRAGAGEPPHAGEAPGDSEAPRGGEGAARASMIGKTIGSYRITALLGEGGMGTVYLAEHPVIGRKAAVKFLRPEFSRDPEAIRRFTREARAAATLRHPAIIDVFDYGVYAGESAYIMMDYLEGENLDALLSKGGRLPPRTAADYARQIAAGVAVAHRAGVIHRDLKPANVFVTSDPVVPGRALLKVLDFGIAKLAESAAEGGATRTDAVIGTPRYMAPEQCRGAGHVDHRADVYSLGCMLYELLLGRPPFLYVGAGELIGAHLHEAPEAPCVVDPLLPPQLEAVVLKMLSKEPDKRQQSMDEVVEVLGAFLSLGQSVPAALSNFLCNEQGPGSDGAKRTPVPLPQRTERVAWTPEVAGGPGRREFVRAQWPRSERASWPRSVRASGASAGIGAEGSAGIGAEGSAGIGAEGSAGIGAEGSAGAAITTLGRGAAEVSGRESGANAARGVDKGRVLGGMSAMMVLTLCGGLLFVYRARTSSLPRAASPALSSADLARGDPLLAASAVPGSVASSPAKPALSASASAAPAEPAPSPASSPAEPALSASASAVPAEPAPSASGTPRPSSPAVKAPPRVSSPPRRRTTIDLGLPPEHQ